MLSILAANGRDVWLLRSGLNPACGCCGAQAANYQSPRKWKNQYGEGVTEGQKINPVNQNRCGILLVGGKVGESGVFDTIRVDHVKTKNGMLTVSVQEKW
jgi:hypothetical protein